MKKGWGVKRIFAKLSILARKKNAKKYFCLIEEKNVKRLKG